MKRSFADIRAEASVKASVTLSKVVGRPAAIELSAVEVLASDEIIPGVCHGERGIGVYVPVTGDVDGGSVLFFPMADAVALAKAMLQDDSGTSDELGELEVSALKELGNIVTGSYVSVLADAAGIGLIGHAPLLMHGSLGDALALVVDGIAPGIEQAVIMEVHFALTQPPMKAYLIVLLDLVACEAVFGCVECA